MCLSYQNSASRRDGNGRGSHEVHLGPAQLIVVFPSGVPLSTGLCAGPRRSGARASSAAMPPTLTARAGLGTEARRRATATATVFPARLRGAFEALRLAHGDV
jgi:hypothetical protein